MTLSHTCHVASGAHSRGSSSTVFHYCYLSRESNADHCALIKELPNSSFRAGQELNSPYSGKVVFNMGYANHLTEIEKLKELNYYFVVNTE